MKNKKELLGIVVSAKMDKTVIVSVNRKIPHPVYKKFINKAKRFYAHDPKNLCSIGDGVRISESRPMSKMKRWKVLEILQKGEKSI
tara:strand:- start:313 stop:570 length:258 start_codon:yes stop_codon:yes gene_type:complete